MIRSIVFFILALTAFALPAAPTKGDPIDSSSSAIYLGTDRVCRVVLSRYEVYWTDVQFNCLSFGGGITASLWRVYDQCPQGPAYLLNPHNPIAQHEYLSMGSYDSAGKTLQIIRGNDPVSVANGIGVAETWFEIAPLTSPSPYSCASANPPPIDPVSLARFCRQHPDVAACL